MIERFNFYDVYGNFLPGLALLTLIWLPFGILLQYWPANAFSSAIAVLVLAYVVGHIVQSFASNVFPSKAKDCKSTRRYPSDFFLDPEDRTFSEAFKKELEQEVFSTFKLKLSVNRYGGGDEETDKQRRNAFFLCRALLIREETVSYGEQFEGLYALMRGLATSFWLGSAYFAGWATSTLGDGGWQRAKLEALFVGLTVAVISTGILVFANSGFKYRLAIDGVTVGALFLALFSVGAILGERHKLSPEQIIIFCGMTLLSLFAGGRCFRAYRYFAEQFAQAIWRDFMGQRTVASREKHASATAS